jgi:hypothetical protein
MESYQKRKKFPSQIKYEKNNPTITFRIRKYEKEKIIQMSEESGKNISELVRTALLDLERDFSDVIEDIEARKDVQCMNKWAIWCYCVKCQDKAYIVPNSKSHNIIIEQMSGYFVHPECL